MNFIDIIALLINFGVPIIFIIVIIIYISNKFKILESKLDRITKLLEDKNK